MNMEQLIGRINFLYKKNKLEGLTYEEKVEQNKLRNEYIEIIKSNFKVQLDTIKNISCK